MFGSVILVFSIRLSVSQLSVVCVCVCVDIRRFLVSALVVVAVPGRSVGALGLRVSVFRGGICRGALSFLGVATLPLRCLHSRPALSMCLRFRIVVTAGRLKV